MRAAVLEAHGEPLAVTDVDAPAPTPEGVVVAVEACGVCRSDWHGWQGDWDWLGIQPQPGQSLGHEPAGRVVAVGEDVDTVREGDHVAVPFNTGDGTCKQCPTGHGNTCENVVPLGFAEHVQGAFAEQLHVPAADHNAVALPDGVSSVEMAGLGCRFMTAFHALAHRANLGAGDWLAVHGCGGVGLSAVHVGDVLAVAEQLGAVETVDAADTDRVPAAVRALAGGGCHVSVDALGIAETCRNSVRSLGVPGQHVRIGLTTAEGRGEVALPTDVMVSKEIEFLGSQGLAPTRYDEIVRMVETGKLDPGAVVSESIALPAVNETLVSVTDYGTTGIPVIDSF